MAQSQSPHLKWEWWIYCSGYDMMRQSVTVWIAWVRGGLIRCQWCPAVIGQSFLLSLAPAPKSCLTESHLWFQRKSLILVRQGGLGNRICAYGSSASPEVWCKAIQRLWNSDSLFALEWGTWSCSWPEPTELSCMTKYSKEAETMKTMTWLLWDELTDNAA